MGKKKRQKPGGPEQTGSQSRSPEPLTLPAAIPLKYQAVVSIFLLVIGVCVLYPELVFQNKVILAGDVEAAASFATPIKQAIQDGESDPLWNPYLFAGMPSYGSLSYTPGVYPVGLLTGFLANVLGFPNFTWLLFHILLLGVGVWLLLLARGVHFLIAAGAGVLMMWMPNHVAVGVHGHGSQACAVAYIPFVLLFWDRLWRGKGVMLNAAVLVVLLGFQLLRGHLQIAYYTFAIMGLHFLFFAVLKIRDGVRNDLADEDVTFGALRSWYAHGSKKRAALVDVAGTAGVLGIVVAGAMLISAVLFIPVQDFAKYSIRGASESGGLDYDYATSWSLHPLESLTFLVPFSFGFGKAYYYGHMPFTDYPNYLGIITAFFAVLAVIVVRTRFVRFLVFIVIVTTLVAYGKYLPILYDPLFKFMPYFNKFRVPVMVLIVQQLAVVLLFGIGLSALFQVDPKSGRKKALLVAAGAVVLLLVVLMSYGYWSNGFPRAIASKLKFVRSAPEQLQFAREISGYLMRDLVKISLLLVSVSALLVLTFKRSMSPLVMVIIVLALAMADLFMIDRYIIHPEALFSYEQRGIIQDKSMRDRFLQPDDVMRYLQGQEGDFRVFPMTHPSVPLNQDFRSNRYMNFGISSIGGYHPAKLTIYEEFLSALGASLQRANLQPVNMLNVRYIVSANPLPENPVWLHRWDGRDYNNQRRYVYENIEALPRVWFVDEVEVAPAREALNRMLAPGVDLSKTAFVDKVPAVTPVSAVGARAQITSRRFNEIRVDASLRSPALLILSEIYYPRWKVEVDGQPAEVLRANHILRAVSLAAGDHTLVFYYDDSLLKKSRTLSRVTLLAAVIIIMAAMLMQLRGRAQWKRS